MGRRILLTRGSTRDDFLNGSVIGIRCASDPASYSAVESRLVPCLVGFGACAVDPHYFFSPVLLWGTLRTTARIKASNLAVGAGHNTDDASLASQMRMNIRFRLLRSTQPFRYSQHVTSRDLAHGENFLSSRIRQACHNV